MEIVIIIGAIGSVTAYICLSTKTQGEIETKRNPGFKIVKVDDSPLVGKINSFLDYQAPEDRYEVRGIMPSSKNKTLVGGSEKVKKRVRKIVGE